MRRSSRTALAALAEAACDLRVVASLPNELSARVLRAPGAGVRFFAPAMRNMLDRDFPLSRFAASIDVLCCNRIEWETLEDREEVGWQVSILVVTDGPRGSTVRYTNPSGDSGLLRSRGVSATIVRRATPTVPARLTGRRSSRRCSTRAGMPPRASSRRN